MFFPHCDACGWKAVMYHPGVRPGCDVAGRGIETGSVVVLGWAWKSTWRNDKMTGALTEETGWRVKLAAWSAIG